MQRTSESGVYSVMLWAMASICAEKAIGRGFEGGVAGRCWGSIFSDGAASLREGRRTIHIISD